MENEVEKIVKAGIESPAALEKIKKKIAEKLKISNPSNAELLKAYHNLISKKRLKKDEVLEAILRKRKIRSLSGIVVVSLLTKPYSCPGKCIYCPTESGIPKSYLSKEPAVMRAVLNKFDPYSQIKMRLRALEENGHPIDKIDLRIIGGTWSYYPKKYQKWFVTRCFEACNNSKSNSLEKEQKRNEKAKHRIIGITIETRPDFITDKEIKWLRELGVTRVELGVQSIYDDVLKLNKRGHNVSDLIKATKLLKDAGFKICYQIMPNLPGSDIKKDKKMFEIIYNNLNFVPDLIKIYPCVILKEAPIYKMKELNHKPYSKKQLINLIKYIKKITPYYVRIQRIIRDIPADKIALGPKEISNLRQVILKEIEKEGWRCSCIRCREVKESYDPKEKLYLFRQDYESSNGKEVFLSYESKNRERLYSLLRLRIGDLAIIREIHTYGQMHPLNKKGAVSPQHKGLGKKLMKEAERITKEEFKRNKLSVISGVGVRGYYRKLGYRLKDTYMVKSLSGLIL